MTNREMDIQEIKSKEINYEEYIEIAKELEKCNVIFQTFWELGKPIITEEIETAAVGFNKEGENVSFMFNPSFWNSISPNKRAFVIAHECLHVVLNHGYRFKDDCEGYKATENNLAADIVINHLLIEKFGFVRSEIDPENEYCWTDTVFPDLKDIPTNKSMEYYLDLFEQNASYCIKEIIDDHEMFSNDFLGEGQIQDSVISKTGENLSDEEREQVSNVLASQYEHEDIEIKKEQGAGTCPGNIVMWMRKENVKKKKKWETIIKKWATTYLKEKDKDQEQWLRVARRLINMPQNIILPTEMELDEIDREHQKIDVFFFLDTSGSCYGLAPRFWKAAKSLPKNRFNVILHCFDTEVYEVIDDKLRGFGGTYFHILESYIQKQIRTKKIKKYPKAIFVITDGYGNRISPERPKNWYWFLSTNCAHYIPKESNIYKLSDFE